MPAAYGLPNKIRLQLPVKGEFRAARGSATLGIVPGVRIPVARCGRLSLQQCFVQLVQVKRYQLLVAYW